MASSPGSTASPPDIPLVRSVKINARPETVFALLIDPVRLVRWKGMKATLDPRPGGIYRVSISPEDVVRGEFVEVTPFRRIVFTWGWEGEDKPLPPGATTVEIDLIPDGDGTRLELTHRGLPPPAWALHGQGWDYYLPRLAVVAAGGDPGPDTHGGA
jgi:uncharacterized protein YndB with AHSA1/START domain